MKPLKRFGIELEKDNFQESVIYGLASVYLYIEKEISDYLRHFNLTAAKFNAMMIIKHLGKEKGLSQVEISRSLIVTASNITRLLDKLEKEKLIERFSREGDRRVNLIRISKTGSDILDKVWPGYHKETIAMASLLNKNDLIKASELLLKWANSLENNIILGKAAKESRPQ